MRKDKRQNVDANKFKNFKEEYRKYTGNLLEKNHIYSEVNKRASRKVDN